MPTAEISQPVSTDSTVDAASQGKALIVITVFLSPDLEILDDILLENILSNLSEISLSSLR